MRPEILLLDEPLCSLDIGLRIKMRTEMAMLFRRLGITVFYVTQDPAEAFSMADRIVIMNRGQIEQFDPPQECYRNPKTETVAAILGIGNRVHGYAREDGGTQIDLGGGVCDTLGRSGIHKDDMVTVRFRAENAVWSGDKRLKNSFPVAVEDAFFEGDYYRVTAKMGMGELLLICPAQSDHFRTGTDQTSCDRKSQTGDSSRHNCCFSGKIIPFLHRKFCFLLFCKSCHDFLQIPYISVISHFRNATSFS